MFETLSFALIILLWPLCFFLIGLILLQGGAGDLSSAFGGGGQLDSTLGVGAGRKMSKVTGWMVCAFLVIVAILAMPHGTIGSTQRRTEALGGPGAQPSISGDAITTDGTNVAPAAPPVMVPPVEAAPDAAPAPEAPADAAAPEAAAPEAAPIAEPDVEEAPVEPAPAEPAAEPAPAEPAAEPAAQPNSTIRIDD